MNKKQREGMKWVVRIGAGILAVGILLGIIFDPTFWTGM
jgi:hypothetical protein